MKTLDDHEAVFVDLLIALDAALSQPNPALRDMAALRAVSSFLETSCVAERLRQPFHDMFMGLVHVEMQRQSGGNVKKPIETVRYARAAAMVTFLHDDGKGPRVKDALTAVSQIVGMDRQKLESFRDNITRALGRAN